VKEILNAIVTISFYMSAIFSIVMCAMFIITECAEKRGGVIKMLCIGASVFIISVLIKNIAL